MEQARLENERRKEEREHELKIFSMMIGNMNQSSQNLGSSYGCDAERVTRYNLDGEKTYVDL